MYSTLNTTNNCVTTNSTTRVDYCEVCNAHGNYYYNIDGDILNLSNYIKDSDALTRYTSCHVLCDKHKKEYDVKLIMKLRKSKLEKINEYNGNMGSL